MASTPKSIGFRVRNLYKLKKPSIFKIARQKLSFLIAAFSLFAFVMGNMVGQHGWYAFWKTVLGKEDETMIVFTGTVPPIAKIPDYALWAQYGGNKRDHLFSQAPSQVLRDLPAYDPTSLDPLTRQVYSTLWAGGYNSPQGSHPGVDIDGPRGTPVLAIASGIVEKVSMGETSFGHFVTIKHPNVPIAPGSTTTQTIYSTYAHMDAVLVTEGQTVLKGQPIGTVGNTGLVFGATGYHLYFQVEKGDAPFHPYWPFTSDEIRIKGIDFVQAVNSTAYQDRIFQYTLSPVAFAEKYMKYVPTVQVAAKAVSVATNLAQTPKQKRAERLAVRSANVRTAASSSSAPGATVVAAISQTVAETGELQPSGGSTTDVDHLSIQHSGKLSRAWQKVRITAVNKNGNTVVSPSFSGRLYVVPEFGEAEIRPMELSSIDFVNGVATVNVLTRGSKTTFIATRGAFTTVSAPMVYER